MPVQIGAKTHNFTDPTGLLSDCHRRIEMFLETLAAAGKVMDAPPSVDTARALQSALVYFRQAAPKHTADEEQSLFPRLRGREEPELKSALSTLDRLEKDHEAVSPLHAEVERLAETYLE
ncbi:MAG: hemerythrin domain-containing protein, partial [Acidobacteriota bacterium]